MYQVVDVIECRASDQQHIKNDFVQMALCYYETTYIDGVTWKEKKYRFTAFSIEEHYLNDCIVRQLQHNKCRHNYMSVTVLNRCLRTFQNVPSRAN